MKHTMCICLLFSSKKRETCPIETNRRCQNQLSCCQPTSSKTSKCNHEIKLKAALWRFLSHILSHFFFFFFLYIFTDVSLSMFSRPTTRQHSQPPAGHPFPHTPSLLSCPRRRPSYPRPSSAQPSASSTPWTPFQEVASAPQRRCWMPWTTSRPMELEVAQALPTSA